MATDSLLPKKIIKKLGEEKKCLQIVWGRGAEGGHPSCLLSHSLLVIVLFHDDDAQGGGDDNITNHDDDDDEWWWWDGTITN